MNDFFDCLFDETPFRTEVPETTETEEECRETEANAPLSFRSDSYRTRGIVLPVNILRA